MVEQAVTRAFRPEFLNRIDRTIVFRPLTRPVMREILTGELDSVLARRGLRARDWAVEFDDSALEFLLAQGFTPDLGARPLKRAVERHFLTPLALAIADHDYPEGDQFLFVRAGRDGLKVTFEDADGAEPAGVAPAETTLRTLAREGGQGLDLLERAYEDVSARVEAEEFQDAKAELLARLGEPGFWDDEGRFPVLVGIELRDRIEAGLRSAASLMNRARNARHPPAALVRRAAQRLLLLDQALDALAAGEPADARLRVEGDPEFAPRVAAMYRGWAQERGMRLEVVEERPGRRFRFVATVSGFAALQVLRPENGFHVLEIPDGRGGYERRRVRVTVLADGVEEPAGGRASIVRRYRERPTPLVRDAVRGWRTGQARRGAVRRVRPRRVAQVREARRRAREGDGLEDQRRGDRGGVGQRADRQRRDQHSAGADHHRAAAGELRAVRREPDADREREREQVADPNAHDREADRDLHGARGGPEDGEAAGGDRQRERQQPVLGVRAGEPAAGRTAHDHAAEVGEHQRDTGVGGDVRGLLGEARAPRGDAPLGADRAEHHHAGDPEGGREAAVLVVGGRRGGGDVEPAIGRERRDGDDEGGDQRRPPAGPERGASDSAAASAT